MWYFRSSSSDAIDPNEVYRDFPNIFTMKINHGGFFTKAPGRKYLNGKVTYVDLVDKDEFSMHEVNVMMKELGYGTNEAMYYHFCMPDVDLDYGLLPLRNDQDVINLFRYISKSKEISVYIEKTGTCSKKLDFDLNKPVESSEAVVTDIVPYQKAVVSTSITEDVGVDFNMVDSGAVPMQEEDVLMFDDDAFEFFDTFFDSGAQSVAYDGDIEEDYQYQSESNLADNLNNMTIETVVATDSNPAEEGEGQGAAEGESEGEGDDEPDGESDGSSSDSDFVVEGLDLVHDVEVDMGEFHSVVDYNVESVGNMDQSANIPDLQEGDIEVIDTESFQNPCLEQDKRQKLLHNLRKPRTCSLGEVHEAEFTIGDTYMSKKHVIDMVKKLSIQTRRDLRIVRNDKVRVRAECKGFVPGCGGPSQASEVKGKGKGISGNSQPLKCPWVLHVSRSKEEDDWMVKTFNDHHICLQSRSIKSCTQGYLSKEILQIVEANPNIEVAPLRTQLLQKYQIQISKMKVFRAKVLAKNKLDGDYESQYSLLWDYALELKRTNEGTTVRVDVESEPNFNLETRKFRRIYVCLGPLKKGFEAGKRDLLGLDGTFLKGPFPGQILTAVGLDSNNGIYPLAYAVVEAETSHSWTWFLQCLGEDLDLTASSNFTFITDRQKGLIPALAKVFPGAEHRFCLRHIHENMKLHWKSKQLKEHLWRCATATTVPFFARAMEDLRLFNNEAFEWLKKIPPKHWARSHFSSRANTDILLNNLCEVFNSKLEDGRCKPIISALEYIREYIMKKICIVQKVIDKAHGILTPTADKLMQAIKDEANNCICIYNGSSKYQVTGRFQDQYVVDIAQKSCTCRKWDITGIPCTHAVAAMYDMAEHGEEVGHPEDWVHPCYKLSTWKAMYQFKIDPINGRQMWPKSNCPTTLLPPKHHKQVGRPKKKRRRGEDEMPSQGSQSNKLSRKYMTVTCGKCHNRGHNSRSCKGQGGPNQEAGGSGAGRNTRGVGI